MADCSVLVLSTVVPVPICQSVAVRLKFPPWQPGVKLADSGFQPGPQAVRPLNFALASAQFRVKAVFCRREGSMALAGGRFIRVKISSALHSLAIYIDSYAIV